MSNKFCLIFGINLLISCSIFSQSDTEHHTEVVDSIIKTSFPYYDTGGYDSAMIQLRLAESYTLEHIGKESLAFGNCCHFLAGTLSLYSSDLNVIESLYKEAIRLRLKFLGTETDEYSVSIFNLGSYYINMSEFEKAEPYLLEAKSIWGRKFGHENQRYNSSLINLGALYKNTQRFELAEQCYLESQGLIEKGVKMNDIDVFGLYVNFGILYYTMNYYEKAEQYLLHAKDIFENKVQNKNHPYYLICMRQLSLLYTAIGQYAKAEPIILKSLKLIEQSGAGETEEFAAFVCDLAVVYYNMGNYSKAEYYYLKDRDFYIRSLPENMIYYINAIWGLGMVYTQTGDFAKAEKCFLEAISHLEANKLKENEEYSGIIACLAAMYTQSNQPEKAFELYSESIGLEEKNGRMNTEVVAFSSTKLAQLEAIKGNYDKAEKLHLKSISIFEKIAIKENPDYLLSLFNIGEFYCVKRDFVKAEQYYKKLSDLNQVVIKQAVRYLSENELQKYLALFSQRQDALFSLAQNVQKTSTVQNDIRQKINLICFDNNLFYKGFLLNVANQTRRLASKDSVSLEKYNRLNSYYRRLATEYARPKEDQNVNYIASLESYVNELEKDIARLVSSYSQSTTQTKWTDVQQNLKKGEAVVEFVHYMLNNHGSDSSMYAAMILKSGKAMPVFMPLFESNTIEDFNKSQSENNYDFINSLYTISKDVPADVANKTATLYDLIWKPLESQLAEIKTIYFSPAGILHRINMTALPINLDKTLGDRFNIIELNSSRQLVSTSDIKIKNNDAVLFGGINYDSDTILSNSEPSLASRSRGFVSFSGIDTTLRGGNWNYLLGTEREINAIGKSMSNSDIIPIMYKGKDGSEEAFKNIGSGKNSSPRILHIATHGFFFPDPKIMEKDILNSKDVIFKTSDNPMMRSGLLLSGANAAWSGKGMPDEREDGILTAYEISQLNLSNTELVVLSACETGLGEIQGNEGVYGLQRAFKIAGAKYLIMSLWQVPDKQTSLLMTTFYNKWLKEKMTIPDAFNAAQKELRDIGLDPYQWAGFILVE